MLTGNRRDILAVGLAAIIAFAGGCLLYYSASTQQSHYQGTAAKYAKQYADRGAEYIKGCVRLPPPERTECKHEAYEAARSGQRYEYDLEAQRVTATWTQHMGIAAMIGMAVSIVGVGLVWTTFAETRRANEFTDKAMRDAATASIPFLEISPYAFLGGPNSHCRVNLCNHGPGIIPSYEVVIEMDLGGVGALPLVAVNAERAQSLTVLRVAQQQYTPPRYTLAQVLELDGRVMTLRATGFYTDSLGRRFDIERTFVASAGLIAGGQTDAINTAIFEFHPAPDA